MTVIAPHPGKDPDVEISEQELTMGELDDTCAIRAVASGLIRKQKSLRDR